MYSAFFFIVVEYVMKDILNFKEKWLQQKPYAFTLKSLHFAQIWSTEKTEILYSLFKLTLGIKVLKTIS